MTTFRPPPDQIPTTPSDHFPTRGSDQIPTTPEVNKTAPLTSRGDHHLELLARHQTIRRMAVVRFAATEAHDAQAVQFPLCGDSRFPGEPRFAFDPGKGPAEAILDAYVEERAPQVVSIEAV